MEHTTSLETSGSNYPFFRPPIRSEAARAQRQLLRTELDKLWATLSVKRAHLNVLAPISYLPHEILGRIFCYVSFCSGPRLDRAEDHTLYYHRFQNKLKFGPLVNITHVCSHWRQVAIQYSKLWFCPPLELGLDWTRTILSRSGSSPLVIEAHRSGPALLPEMIPSIHEHLSHIQTLHISASYDVLSQLFSMLNQPARMLASLALDQPQNYRVAPGGGLVSCLPQTLFAGNAPELRELSLFNCVVPWSCTILRNLVSLHINVPSRTEPLCCIVDGVLTPLSLSEVLPSMSQLLEVLRASPMLQSLGLREILPRASSIPFHNPTSILHGVHLPDLRHFSLVASARDSAAFLSRLFLPKGVIFDLQWSFEDTENPEAEYTSAFDVLEQHYDRFDHRDSASFSYFCYTGPIDYELVIDAKLCHITITTPMDDATRANFLRAYFFIIPLAEVFSLAFHDDGSLSCNQLMDIFAHAHLQGVWAIRLYGGRIDAFVTALTVLEDNQLPYRRQATFRMAPVLSVLELDGIDFTESTTQEMVALQNNFISLLQEREAQGHAIRQLEFEFCPGLDEAWVDALRVVKSTEISFKQDSE